MIAVNQQQKKETEIRKTEKLTMESLEKGLLTIKFKLGNSASTQPLENFAEKVKTNRNEIQTEFTSDTRSGTRQNSDRHNIMLMKTIQKFIDSIELKNAFASIYPNKKFCTPLLQRVAIYILSSPHKRRLTLFCRNGRPIFWGATRRYGELVTEMNSTAP